MKYAVILILIVALFAVGCTQQQVDEATGDNVDVDVEEQEVKVDTTGDGDPDVAAKQMEDHTEITVDFDEVQEEEIVPVENFCQPGETYTYADSDGSVDAKIIGLTTYKGKEYCKAEATTTVESPAGTLTNDVVYYFDNTYKDFWVTTTTSGPMLPAPQTNEVHIVDGEVTN